MTSPDIVELTGSRELLQAEFSDRLQHCVARGAVRRLQLTDEAVVDENAQAIQHVQRTVIDGRRVHPAESTRPASVPRHPHGRPKVGALLQDRLVQAP